MTNPTSLPPRVAELSAALSRPGPYYTLTQATGGKTRSRYVAAEQVPVLRRQIEAGREFRRQVEAYWDACEQWADAESEPTPAAEAAEKKGSRRVSGKRSGENWKPSWAGR